MVVSTQFDVCFLDGLRVVVNGVQQPLPRSRKTRALLAYLALNRGSLRRDVLCALWWEDNNDPRAALRWALSKVRRVLGDALLTQGTEVTLDRSRLRIDLDELETTVAATLEANKPVPSLEALTKLAERLQQPWLSDLDCAASPLYQLWLESERTRLRQLHCDLLRCIVEHDLINEHQREAHLQRWLTLNPGSIDAASRLLTSRLERSGLPEAQRVFDRLRRHWLRLGKDDMELLRCWRSLSHNAISISTNSRLSQDNLGSTAVSEGSQSEQTLVLPDKPSLAVLGFTTLGEQATSVLAQGLTVDLSSRLSRLSGLFVSAPASAMRFAQSDLPPKTIGERLGVAYLLQGTCQSDQTSWRVTVNLLAAASQQCLWSDSYHFHQQELFDLQDEITNTIVSRIEPEIERAEYERTRQQDPSTYDAWENYHVALWHAFRFTASDTEIAHAFLSQALQQDAGFSRAHAAMSLVHFNRAFLNCSATQHASSTAEEQIKLAHHSAKRSIGLDNKDAMGHWSLGRALFLARRHDLALDSVTHALQVNPNYAQGHYALGFISAHGGVANAAVSELDRAARLSPYDPLLFAMKSSRAISLAVQGEYQQAAHWGVRATEEANAHFHIFAIAAACLELSGQHSEARRYVQQALDRHPGYCQRVFFRSFPYKLDQDRAIMADALSRAGLAP